MTTVNDRPNSSTARLTSARGVERAAGLEGGHHQLEQLLKKTPEPYPLAGFYASNADRSWRDRAVGKRGTAHYVQGFAACHPHYGGDLWLCGPRSSKKAAHHVLCRRPLRTRRRRFTASLRRGECPLARMVLAIRKRPAVAKERSGKMERTSAPQRIQLQRTKGWRMPPNTRKVDRSTSFGNPFEGKTYGRDEAVAMHRAWLTGKMTDEVIEGRYPSLVAKHLISRRHHVLNALLELQGKTSLVGARRVKHATLTCYCSWRPSATSERLLWLKVSVAAS